MQQYLFPLREVSAASKFYRSISTSPADGLAICKVEQNVAEINLTVHSLRRLEPIPENEWAFVSGPAAYSHYHVWLAGMKYAPLYLGSFNVPNHGHGSFYSVFDPDNINGSGLALGQFSWLMVTASSSVRRHTWPGDVDAGVLFGNLSDEQSSPLCLFTKQGKESTLDDDLDEDEMDEYDEDDDDQFDIGLDEDQGDDQADLAFEEEEDNADTPSKPHP